MDDKTNMCITCLSLDRRLVPLNQITLILEEINFVVLNDYYSGVCWECWSVLFKFYRLKNKACMVQFLLSQTPQQPILPSLSTLTANVKQDYDYNFTFDLDPLDKNSTPKDEPNTVKQEMSHDEDDNVDITADLDKNLPDNVYIEDPECVQDDNLFIKTENKEQNVETKNNVGDAKIKNSEINEIFVDSVKLKSDKVKTEKVIKKTNNTKIINKDVAQKFLKVILSEEEMVRIREEKRNHYNYKKVPYKCDGCVLGFAREENYNKHLKEKHDEGIGEDICDVCTRRFAHKLVFLNHRSKHFVSYRCKLCKYVGHELWAIRRHCLSKHVEDMPDKIHCDQCKTVVRSPVELEAHMQSVHTLYCKECGLKFKVKRSLKQHLERIHSVQRQFVCDICKITFITKTRLESHIVKHNANIAKKLAYCQQCNIQYKDIFVYRSHLKSSANHSERKQCPDCNKKFASKTYWRKHYNFYHLKKSQFHCDICNKLFISDWRLKNHRQKHHGLSRPRNHPCNVCSKKFYTPAMLRNHQLTHSDERLFMCEDCGDTFKQSAALYTHTRLVHKRRLESAD